MTTIQELYITNIKKFLEQNFKTYPNKNVSYVESSGYTMPQDSFVIETENCGFVFIHPQIATSMKPYGYCIYTQKFAKKWYNEEQQIFDYSDDSRFEKNNLLCQDSIQKIKDFILNEYK